MKRILVLPVLLIAALALVASVAADPGPHGKDKNKGKHKGSRITFVLNNTDDGSCGNPWANLVERRTFQVKDNGDGTYRVWRRDRGVFQTIGPASPGACETTKPHGTLVRPGVKGKFQGFLVGTVTGGTFNPAATCTGTSCGFTDVFITTFFGPAAQFSCFANSADCKFNYEYSAPGQHLRLHHWQDKGTGAGTMLKERFKGDISDNRVQ
jgi:hypothetical protein